jgi:hypothetical protein
MSLTTRKGILAMRRRAITVIGAAVAAFLLTTTTASADTIITAGKNNIKWKRSCDTVYAGAVAPTYAITNKRSNGKCAGHAWLRVYTSTNGWTAWEHSPTGVEITSSGGHITRAEHKGCADCTVYGTRLRN